MVAEPRSWDWFMVLPDSYQCLPLVKGSAFLQRGVLLGLTLRDQVLWLDSSPCQASPVELGPEPGTSLLTVLETHPLGCKSFLHGDSQRTAPHISYFSCPALLFLHLPLLPTSHCYGKASPICLGFSICASVIPAKRPGPRLDLPS